MSISRAKRVELLEELSSFASNMMQNAKIQFKEFTKEQTPFKKEGTIEDRVANLNSVLASNQAWPKQSKDAYLQLINTLNEIKETQNPDLTRMKFYREAYKVLAGLKGTDQTAIDKNLKGFDYTISLTPNAKRGNADNIIDATAIGLMKDAIFGISPNLRQLTSNQVAKAPAAADNLTQKLPSDRQGAGGGRAAPPPFTQPYQPNPVASRHSEYGELSKSVIPPNQSNAVTFQPGEYGVLPTSVTPPNQPNAVASPPGEYGVLSKSVTPPNEYVVLAKSAASTAEPAPYGELRITPPPYAAAPSNPKAATPPTSTNSSARMISEMRTNAPPPVSARASSSTTTPPNEYGELSLKPAAPVPPKNPPANLRSGSLVKLTAEEEIKPADPFTPPSPRGRR